MKILTNIKKVFQEIEKVGAKYCIIRNYDFIDESEEIGKDIDVVIERKSVKKVSQVLRNNDFFKSNTNSASNHLVFTKYYANDRRFVSMHLHTGGVSGATIQHYKASKLLENSQKVRDLNVPTDTYLALGILVHVIFDRGEVQKKYERTLAKIAKKVDKECLQKELSKFMKNPEEIVEFAFNAKYAEINARIKILQKQYYKRQFFKRISFCIRTFFWIISRFKSRAVISVIGMDGAGKSTLIASLDKIISTGLIKHSTIYLGRGKGNIVPIQKMFSRSYVNSLKNLKEIKKGISIKRVLAAPVFAVDLAIRYFLQILPKEKEKDLVITDRASTDILLMKGVPEILKKIIYLLLPKPKYAIYLYNTPAVLHARKPHPIADLIRQEKEFQKILKRVPHCKILSVDPEQTLQEAMKVVVIALKAKQPR